MHFFIPAAYAAGNAAVPPGPGFGDFGFLIVLFAVFWFLLIRPQQKRTKEHRKMIEAITKGDEVVTNGGLLGKVVKVGDHFVTLEVKQGIEVHVQRSAIAAVQPKGTLKSI